MVLDTTLTPALIEEGLARDFVRGIQDARKQAGYQIDDTIDISFVADPEVSRAIEAHRDVCHGPKRLATMLEGESVAGASDAVEPELVEGPGGLRRRSWMVPAIRSTSVSTRFALPLRPTRHARRMTHCAQTQTGFAACLAWYPLERRRDSNMTRCSVRRGRLPGPRTLAANAVAIECGAGLTAASADRHTRSEDER